MLKLEIAFKLKEDIAFSSFNRIMKLNFQFIFILLFLISSCNKHQPNEKKNDIISKNENIYTSKLLENVNNLSGSGNVYIAQEKFDSALIKYQQALSSMLLGCSKNEHELSGAYNNMGRAYLKLGDNDNALKNFQKALIFNSCKKDILNSSLIYFNISNVYLSEGNYTMASEYINKSLSIRTDLLGSSDTLTLQVLKQKSQLLIAENKNKEALEILKFISKTQDSIGDKDSNAKSEVDYLIGEVCLNLDYYEMAIRYCVKALNILEKKELKNSNLEIAINQTIGQVYESAGNVDLAIIYYNKALVGTIKKYGRNGSHTASVLNKIAGNYLVHNQFENALEYYQQAIKANFIGNISNDSIRINDFNKVGTCIDYSKMIESIYGKALALEYWSNNFSNNIKEQNRLLIQAFSYYQVLNILIKRALNSTLAQTDQMAILEKSERIYEKALGLCFKLYNVGNNKNFLLDNAIQFIEANKSNVLYRSILVTHAIDSAGLPESLNRSIHRLTRQKQQLTEAIAQAESGEKKQVDELHNKLFETNREYENLVQQIGEKYPLYFSLSCLPTCPKISEISKSIDDSTVIINYFTGIKTLFILVISRNTADFFAEEINSSFETLVKDFYLDICNYRFEGFSQHGKALYELLINPIEKNIERKKQLLFVPQDYLLYLPFEALFKTSGQKTDFTDFSYLVKNYDISYLYSVSLTQYNIKNRKSYKDISKTFFGIAPGFMKSDFKEKMIVDSAILNELPFSIKEVQSIKTLFNNAGLVAKSLVKQEATKNNFLKYENYFDIIHIATHGYSYDNKPELSYLAFAPEEKKADFKNFFIGNKLNKEQTWIMRSGAMYNLNLHADLLVLSACETGFGAMKRGEGIMAMTRGFIYSGASNIVYTLWGVEDKTTSQLMYDFYKNILFGDKYPNALRKAKINLINSPNTAFPRSWAGYFLLGE